MSYPGHPPGPAPAGGRAGTGTGAPCRGMPPIMAANLIAAAASRGRSATAPQRVQLFWVADRTAPSAASREAAPMLSVFQAAPPEATTALKKVLLADKALDELFARKKSSAVKPSASAKSVGDAKSGELTKRGSVLSAAASQKYNIIVRCLRKSYDEPDGWKKALLSGRLDKADINLLLETIPDLSESSKRKAQDWLEAVNAVGGLTAAASNTVLLPDEDFVAFMASIPNLHQRLQCLLVMQDFDDLIAKVMRELEALADALELLVRSSGIPRLFSAILIVGNYLNEGTALGKRTSFRLETLRRVESLRAPTGGKSLLYFLASRLGPLLSPAEMAILHRAAQLTLIQPIQTACRLQDIFRMLAEEDNNHEELDDSTAAGTDKSPSICGESYHTAVPGARSSCLMRQHRDANIDQIADGFAAVGRRFVEEHREHFLCLKSDARRLLMDYQAAVHYYGDAESLLPFDKKVDDPQNPGQSRFVPDLFQVMAQCFTSYNSALREFELDRAKHESALTRSQSSAAGANAGLPSVLRRPAERDSPPVVSSAAAAVATHDIGHSATPPVRSVTDKLTDRVTERATESECDGETRASFASPVPKTPVVSVSGSRGELAPPVPQDGHNSMDYTSQPAAPCRRTSMRPSLFSVSVAPAAVLHGASLEAVTELIDVDSSSVSYPRTAASTKPPLGGSGRLDGGGSASKSRLLLAAGGASSSRLLALARGNTTTTTCAGGNGGSTSWLSHMRQRAGVRQGGIGIAAKPLLSGSSTSTSGIAATSKAGGSSHVRRRESLRAISGYIQAMHQQPSSQPFGCSPSNKPVITGAGSAVSRGPPAGGVPLVGLDAASRRLLGTPAATPLGLRPAPSTSLTSLKESQCEKSSPDTTARRLKRADYSSTPTLSARSFSSRLTETRGDSAAAGAAAVPRFSASTSATSAAARKPTK